MTMDDRQRAHANPRQKRFVECFPEIHPQVLPFFPYFDYRHPVDGAVLDFSRHDNCTGHQQRAVTTWWAIEKCSPLDQGLDLGSPKGLTPFCSHIDVFGYGGEHPLDRYKGVRKDGSLMPSSYKADFAYDAANIHEIVPQSSLPYIASNHSLEHMPPAGNDDAIVEIVCRWMSLLRQGGVLAMVVPDNDHVPVLQIDADHKNAWGHSDFRPRVLDKVLSRGIAREISFNTLNNRFSFDVVLERT